MRFVSHLTIFRRNLGCSVSLRLLGVILIVAFVQASPISTAYSSTTSALNTLSFALSAGRWILKDRVEVYYLRVQGAGRTQSEARDQAFRLAVAQAIGTLLVTETVLRDGRIVRDELIAHSSGMIHDFREIETRTESALHVVVIDVWVARSEISNRILSQSRDTGRIEGERLSKQIDSFKETRKTGDGLVRVVLRDFPARAFSVTLEKTSVTADSQRSLHLLVPVRLAWDPAWLKSLTEAAEGASHQPGCNSFWYRASRQCASLVRLLVGYKGGYFDDEVVKNIAENEMWKDPPRLLLTILDKGGTALFRECYTTEMITAWGAYFFMFNNGLFITPQASARVEMSIDLRLLSAELLDRVQVDLVRDSGCPKGGAMRR